MGQIKSSLIKTINTDRPNFRSYPKTILAWEKMGYSDDPRKKEVNYFETMSFDIIVDLRPESKTYMEWISFELNATNRHSIHIPPGCANAFMTLEDNCIIHYYCSHPYTPSAESGIRYNDPCFNFQWPYEPLIISEKDKNHPDFQES